ncbi:MAG: DNA polymerase III subunit delta [Planctomycetaceae bacterium]
MHAAEYVKDSAKHATGPVVAIHGKERFLKQAALAEVVRAVLGEVEGEDQLASRFDGTDEFLELKSVADELRTVSMWGDRRLVIVEDADTFVTNHRAGLEKYLEHPAKKGVLVLEVKTWPSNTRLAKAVAKAGLPIECAELKGPALLRWLQEHARDRHDVQLPRDAAALMVEFAGESLGLLDQEIAKLAAYAGDRKKIGVDDVRVLVGGWKAETTFAMMDAVIDGDLASALALLGKLYDARQAPEYTLGGLAFKMRPLARVTALTGRGMRMQPAIYAAGVHPRDREKTEPYLRRIGRRRAEKLLRWLLVADGKLKGEGRTQERMAVERLLVELGGRG